MKRFAKPILFFSALIPLLSFGGKALRGRLGANPIDDFADRTGLTTLIFLILTLSVTPIRKIFRFNEVAKYRRMIGLFAFFYGTLHFLTYIWLDQFFDFPEIVRDVRKRPFIAAGFTGFVLMIPLALTSTRKAIARLGKRWATLHRLVYVSAIAGGIHFLWLVKADTREPFIYLGIIGALLLYRLVRRFT